MKTKKLKNIDYGFRPDSYWAAADPLAAVLLNVKGTNRRQMITDYWNAGKFEELGDELKTATLSGALVHQLGRIHPSFMGGEYLPDYRPRETEIARIELQSVTADVISIRARPVGKRIRYSIIDEYETEFELVRQTSLKPFTLEQLVQFIDESRYPDQGPGLALANNEGNAGGDLSSREDLRHFTTLRSDVYPELYEHYEHVFDEWAREPQGEES
jgi:hypothetical protein